jgi:hypothetical protein
MLLTRARQPQDAATATLIAAMSAAPDGTRQLLIDNTIKALKAAGLWTKIDALYMTAAHDSQAALLNWKAPGTWTLAGTANPTFTADQGYKGDGSSSFLTASGYNPSTAGGSFALNSAVFGVWVQQSATIASSRYVSMGSTSFMSLNGSSTGLQSRVNDATTLNATPNDMTATHWASRRLSSAGKDVWEAGTLHTATDVSTSTSMGTSFSILAVTTPASFSDGRVAAAYTAGGLTDAEMAAMDGCLRSYMQGVGVV